MTAMILSSRGASAITRSIIKDLCKLTESEEECKFDIKKDKLALLDLMDMNDCNSIVFFETTKRTEKLWILSDNMSILFSVYNLFSIRDLNFANNTFVDCGNELLFSKEFEEVEKLIHVKQVFNFVFKSDKKKDRAMCFFYLDDKIWVRFYKLNGMCEIGPRIVMEVDKILEGRFSGKVLFNKKEPKTGDILDESEL